jgi:uncharacterized protein (DUF3084 family)
MDINIVIGIIVGSLVAIVAAYIIGKSSANKNIGKYKNIKDAIQSSKIILEKINSDTKDLQNLKKNADKIHLELEKDTKELSLVSSEIEKLKINHKSRTDELSQLMSKLDLYTRIDELVENGHFEIPEYLYETSARFVEEIKRARQRQKDLIKDKHAVTYPISTIISDNDSYC